jgi:hypothetical protein
MTLAVSVQRQSKTTFPLAICDICIGPSRSRFDEERPKGLLRNGNVLPSLVTSWTRLAERSKRGTDLFREKLWLLPGREVPSFGEPVVIDEFGYAFSVQLPGAA